MRPDPISQQLELVDTEANQQRRARLAEELIATLFRRAHFTVELNAGAGRPRQTDLVATNGTETYLVEVKWRKRAVHVGDVDALRSRLGRTTTTAGVLVSAIGFSSEAIAAVEADRAQPVLLVSRRDIDDTIDWGRDLGGLLRRKLQYLSVRGIALLDQEDRQARRTRGQTSLPPGDRVFVSPAGERSQIFAGGGDFGEYTFVMDLTNIDHAPTPGRGVHFDLHVHAGTVSDIRRVMEELAEVGWATARGQWCIQQAETNWHGFGSQEFLDALDGWRERYRTVKTLHHTEQACYYDTCDGGLYSLVADISAGEERAVRFSNLSFQLVGIPLDDTPFRRLQHEFEIAGPSFLRVMEEDAVTYHHLERGLEVQAVAWIAERDAWDERHGEWVTGVVTTNPFFGERARIGFDSEHLPHPLVDSEFLVCSLRQHHPLSDHQMRYALERCESTTTGDATLVEVVARWWDLDERREAPRRFSEVGPDGARSELEVLDDSRLERSTVKRIDVVKKDEQWVAESGNKVVAHAPTKVEAVRKTASAARP